MKIFRQLLLLASFACLLAGPMPSRGADIAALDQALKSVPSDVVALVRRKIECRDWSNKEISDETSDSETFSALSRLKCDRLDADEAALRAKYARSPAALSALDAARGLAP